MDQDVKYEILAIYANMQAMLRDWWTTLVFVTNVVKRFAKKETGGELARLLSEACNRWDRLYIIIKQMEDEIRREDK